jgi:hypothetical protein
MGISYWVVVSLGEHVVMNIQAIYDRLQRDYLSIFGISPQLRYSRAPLYEASWKDLLDVIEWLGTERCVDARHIPTTEKSNESYCLLDNSQIAKSDCELYEIRKGSASGFIALLTVPRELTDLVLAFLRTRNPRLLRGLRQACLITYKSKSNEVTAEQEEKAIMGFTHRNDVCESLSSSHYRLLSRSGSQIGRTLALARTLINIVLDPVDWYNIQPAHGPGAVSDCGKGIEKWEAIDGQTSRITDKFYPLSDFFSPTPDSFDHESARFSAPHCNLAIVPKDRRGPRVICTQPSWLMWIQQGQWKSMRRTIETARILQTNRHLVSDVGRCSIKFDKQQQNGGLALESSRTREFATIDLADASDLVSWGLVKFLLNKRNTQFLAASRSTHVKIRGDLVKLHMYAPVGSVMCFPVETLVFWVIATAAILVRDGVTREKLSGSASKFLQQNLSEVFVFGDDILVRREACELVCERFREIGFKPNKRKTFSEGFYRESCGVDAYYGERLDIVRLQSLTLTSMSDAYATIELVNRARGMGYVQLAEYLECQVESYLGFGIAAGNCGGAFWTRGWPSNTWGQHQALMWNLRHGRKIRYNYWLDYYEAWTVIASPRLLKAPQDGRSRLFRGLTTGVSEHTIDWSKPDDLQYDLGWARAF